MVGEVGGAGYDPDEVHAKYLAERDKRLVPGRADIRDLTRDEHFASYRRDPFTPVEPRDPVADDVDVVIVGGGIAGVVAGAQLRKAGIDRIRIIDQAGGIGGTWYWNRYPGVMCDVESYIYMPMLEELDYVPTRRYASGEEIRAAPPGASRTRFDLVSDALFHTGVTAWPVGRGVAPAGASPPTVATRSAAATTCWRSGSSTCSSCRRSRAWSRSRGLRSTPPGGTTSARAVAPTSPSRSWATRWWR